MTFDPSGLTAYVNGEFVDAAKASVSIFDHGFLYGDGVFEGMRVFDGGLFRAELHMARIARSARTIGLTMPVDELLDIIGEVVRRSELTDAHVRPIIARGFGGPGIDPRNCPEPTRDRLRLSVPAVPGQRPDQALHQRRRAQGAALAGRAREVAQLPRRRSSPSSRRASSGCTTR